MTTELIPHDMQDATDTMINRMRVASTSWNDLSLILASPHLFLPTLIGHTFANPVRDPILRLQFLYPTVASTSAPPPNIDLTLESVDGVNIVTVRTLRLSFPPPAAPVTNGSNANPGGIIAPSTPVHESRLILNLTSGVAYFHLHSFGDLATAIRYPRSIVDDLQTRLNSQQLHITDSLGGMIQPRGVLLRQPIQPFSSLRMYHYEWDRNAVSSTGQKGLPGSCHTRTGRIIRRIGGDAAGNGATFELEVDVASNRAYNPLPVISSNDPLPHDHG